MASTPTCSERRLAVKVCGMRHPDNIAQVAALGPDMMGFIFWPGSKRCARGLDPAAVRALPGEITRVGVFVDAAPEEIAATVARYGLQMAQLHGDETPGECQALRQSGIRVAKAIGVAAQADIDRAMEYQDCADLLLFDTKSSARGGTGVAYDRSLLARYTGHVPFLMSGGIAPGDEHSILAMRHPRLLGVDLNSRFETAPGVKSIPPLLCFINNLRNLGYEPT